MNTTAPQMYTQVPFAKLQDYLHHIASAEAVNYIEVTDIDAEALSVHAEDSEYTDEQSPIGSILKKCGKKVALKLPKTVKYLQSMKNCFSGCTGLVSLAAIPEGVKDLKLCFADCESLIEAPVIPESVMYMGGCFQNCKSLSTASVLPSGVTDIKFCFAGCESLTEVPVIPESVMYMGGCFEHCTNLAHVPCIPKSAERLTDCFSGCGNLTAGSITGHL